MGDITIPESTLREVVAAQLALKFNDPEIVQSFVSSVLETRVDGMGRVSNRVSDPTMVRWAVEGVIRKFVEETARAWLEDSRDELVSHIGEILSDSNVIQRIAQETASKITVR